MAKNTAGKKEQLNQSASQQEEAPLITDALEDVLVTRLDNDIHDEAALINPIDVAPLPQVPQENAAVTGSATTLAPDAPVLPGQMQLREAWKPQQEQQSELQPSQQLDVAPALQAEAQPLPTGKMQQQTTATSIAPVKSEERLQIEQVLANGLVDMYKTMTPQEQVAFRQKGEEVSNAIEQMLHGFKATTKKVLLLIREWLRLIPRVNLYFLEQESKIKTDEILKLQRKLKKDRRNRVDLV